MYQSGQFDRLIRPEKLVASGDWSKATAAAAAAAEWFHNCFYQTTNDGVAPLFLSSIFTINWTSLWSRTEGKESLANEYLESTPLFFLWPLFIAALGKKTYNQQFIDVSNLLCEWHSVSVLVRKRQTEWVNNPTMPGSTPRLEAKSNCTQSYLGILTRGTLYLLF